jgi:uncharacterized membrane protein (UPF0127 family)
MLEVVAATPRGDVLLCRVAGTGRDRRAGLRGARRLSPEAALLVPNATSVHTFGMRFPILVVRLDDAFTVVDVRRVRPWRYVTPMRGARNVLECHEDVDVRVGDVLRIGRSAGDRANEREGQHRDNRQGDDDDRNEIRGPSRESDWFAAGGVWFDEPQELQQRPHRYKASAADLAT